MKSLFDILQHRFTQLPENLAAQHTDGRYFRFLVTMNYAYLSGSIIIFVLIAVFFLIGVYSLALYNIASFIIWLIFIGLNLRGNWRTALTLAYFEVFIHSVLCSIFLGWHSYFHLFLLLFQIVFFLAPIRVNTKIFAAAANTLCYGALSYVFQYLTPLHDLNPTVLLAMKVTNIFTFCFVLAYVAYYYSRSAEQGEKELKTAYEKTNAVLFERNQAMIRLNEELSEAAYYVKAMLPQPISDGPVRIDWKFVPSHSLGGDAFGYHWLDDDHFAVYLLDVSGHGVGAALLSVSVMNALRSGTLIQTDLSDPRQVLTSLNNAFPGEQHNNMFFTIWYGVYHKSSRRLTYASGGHPPALLFMGMPFEKSDMSLLKTNNLVIGGMRDTAFQEGSQQVDNPSCLYIFSDGVYEIAKADGSMWRFTEFSEFVRQPSSQQDSEIERIFRHTRKINQFDSFEDDFTIIEVVFT